MEGYNKQPEDICYLYILFIKIKTKRMYIIARNIRNMKYFVWNSKTWSFGDDTVCSWANIAEAGRNLTVWNLVWLLQISVSLICRCVRWLPPVPQSYCLWMNMDFFYSTGVPPAGASRLLWPIPPQWLSVRPWRSRGAPDIAAQSTSWWQ